jgi:hypothetical protein
MAPFPAWDFLLFALPTAQQAANWIFVFTVMWMRNEMARPPLSL